MPPTLTLPTHERMFTILTGHTKMRAWQKQYLETACSTRFSQWEQAGLLNVPAPTGTGKSAVPIMVLIASLIQPDVPRRIIYVVNRRLIVDTVYDLAKAATAMLRDPDTDELRAMRLALLDRYLDRYGISAPELANEAAKAPMALRLRGGLEEIERPYSPIIPAIICSTIEQAGSRLLFRGYGVSARMAPIWAGLMAIDTLWIIDEAHAESALLKTLNSVRQHIAEAEHPVGAPLSVITMTATPRTPNSKQFVPRDAEEMAIVAAPKTLQVECVENPNAKAFLAYAQSWASSHVTIHGSPRKLAVIANSVLGARAVFANLRKHFDRTAKVELLIGPQRPRERIRLLEKEFFTAIKTNAGPTENPLILVATQTIEIGVDFDFDALLTESAPMDALIQRAGRVNRSGRGYGEITVFGGSHVPNKVLLPYRDLPYHVIEFLLEASKHGPIDFSPTGIAELAASTTKERWKSLLPPESYAELLYPQHIRSYERTYPPQRNDIDPSWFLRGTRGSEVSIIWREGMREDLSDLTATDIERWLDLVPIRRDEIMALSLTQAHRLLDSTAPDGGDVEQLAIRTSSDKEISAEAPDTQAEAPDEETSEQLDRQKKKALSKIAVVRHGKVEVIPPNELRPGDTVILSCERKGVDEWGWNPLATGAKAPKPTDYSGEHQCAAAEQSEDVSRTAPPFPETPTAVLIHVDPEALGGEDPGSLDGRAAILAHAEMILQWYGSRPVVYRDPLNRRDPLNPARDPFLIAYPKPTWCRTDDDSYRSQAIDLHDHLQRVGERAAAYAQILGLSDEHVVALAHAGYLHDIGKAAPEFQRNRLGNNVTDRILAKRQRRVKPNTWSWRHELASVGMLPKTTPSLACFLVGTHHGYARPGFPEMDTVASPISYTLPAHPGARIEAFTAESRYEGNTLTDESGWYDLMREHSQRHSAWGLAYLEAILRLSDWRASDDERDERKGGNV